MKWIDIAQADLKKGIKEWPGSSKDNPAILQYYRDSGNPQKHDEVAWCAAFVGSCLERAGIRSTRSLAARSYLQWGQKLSRPREGCIVVFWRGSKSGWQGHVGFYVRETSSYIYVLGGNQGNRVSVAAYPKSRLLGYRWPSHIPDQAPAVIAKGPENNDAFDKAFEIISPLEGGFTDHPKDPGGPTNMGIILSEYANFLGQRLTKSSRAGIVEKLKNIPVSHAKAIYYHNYWAPMRCNEMPLPIAIYACDTALLHGVTKGKKYLQEALGVEIDGEIGPITMGAALESNAEAVLNRYRDIRERQLRKSKNWGVFGKGWTNRINAVLEDCLRLIEPKDTVKVSKMTEIKTPEPKPWTQSLTIWGTVITFLSTVLPAIGPIIGINISADIIQAFGQAVAEAITVVGGLVGTFMAIYGRWRAAQPLKQALVKVKI